MRCRYCDDFDWRNGIEAWAVNQDKCVCSQIERAKWEN